MACPAPDVVPERPTYSYSTACTTTPGALRVRAAEASMLVAFSCKLLRDPNDARNEAENEPMIGPAELASGQARARD
jgi:hypothetical protein